MRMDELPVAEVDGRIVFTSAASLRAHLEKHVLEGRDERWWKSLDEARIAAAREEWGRVGFGPACETLARDYEKAVSDAIQDACRRGLWHVHVAVPTIEPRAGVVASREQVRAWHPGSRILALASASVRNEKLGRFRIVTGFRSWPGMSEKAFERRAREKVREHLRIREGRMLAAHDPEFEGAREGRAPGGAP